MRRAEVDFEAFIPGGRFRRGWSFGAAGGFGIRPYKGFVVVFGQEAPAAFDVLEGTGLERRCVCQGGKTAIFIYEVSEFSLVVFRRGLVGCSDCIVVLECDAQDFVPVATFAVGIVPGVFDRGVIVVGYVGSGRFFVPVFTRCVAGDFAGFFAAEDVYLGPFACSISSVILVAVVIEVERVVVIVELFGVAARLVFKLFGSLGAVAVDQANCVVFVIIVGGVTGGVVITAPEEFFGC